MSHVRNLKFSRSSILEKQKQVHFNNVNSHAKYYHVDTASVLKIVNELSWVLCFLPQTSGIQNGFYTYNLAASQVSSEIEKWSKRMVSPRLSWKLENEHCVKWSERSNKIRSRDWSFIRGAKEKLVVTSTSTVMMEWERKYQERMRGEKLVAGGSFSRSFIMEELRNAVRPRGGSTRDYFNG